LGPGICSFMTVPCVALLYGWIGDWAFTEAEARKSNSEQRIFTSRLIINNCNYIAVELKEY